MGRYKPLTVARNFLKSPYNTGEILPTSLASARVMASFIAPGGKTLEIGAGTGAVTAGIVERLTDTALLTCVELNPVFGEILRENFPSTDVIIGDAASVLEANKTSYDSIVSTMPFGNFSGEKQRHFFKLISEALRPGGVYVMIQYSLLSWRHLKSQFQEVKIAFSFRNLPPAIIYVCKGPIASTTHSV